MAEDTTNEANKWDRLNQVQANLAEALAGQKVYLKAVEREDLVKRADWINDPVVQRTLNFQYPTSVAKMHKWLDSVLSDVSRRDFSVFTRQDNAYIGFGGFLHIDEVVGKAELYATIGERSYWGIGGYGTDAYRTLMKYGFLELGLNKIYGYQLTFNRSAQRVVEKLGWTVEGVLRQEIRSHGELKDRTVVSILRSEWLQQQEGQL